MTETEGLERSEVDRRIKCKNQRALEHFQKSQYQDALDLWDELLDGRPTISTPADRIKIEKVSSSRILSKTKTNKIASFTPMSIGRPGGKCAATLFWPCVAAGTRISLPTSLALSAPCPSSCPKQTF